MPDRTKMLSQLLDLHLSRSIERHHVVSKYTEVRERFKSMREKHDDRLDALVERMDKHESTSDVVFRAFEGKIEEQELGMSEMEKDVKDMKNDTENGGETKDVSAKFSDGGEKG